MAGVKRPVGIFPYIGTAAYGDRLADAVENTCAEESVVPPPREAITEGLASALGDTVIKGLVVTRRGQRLLVPSAYRVVMAGGEKVLLLICDVHGASVVPWHLNDRTAGAWSPPSEDAMQRVSDLLAAEMAVETAEKEVKLAGQERDARRRDGEEPQAAAALAAADDKYRAASNNLEDALRERDRVLSVLGNRRPRPVVRPAKRDGRPAAAFALAPQTRELAAHLQRYAVEELRRAGRQRGYDLAESLVAAGQLSRGMCVLQQWQLQQTDGQVTKLWRMVAVTANNRALARLDIYGVKAEELVTGMPHARFPMRNDVQDSPLLLLNQREILNRISHNLNAERASDDPKPDHPAERAAKITSVPTDVVIGCSNPSALEQVLRTLNVDDHLRGVQPYDDDARLVALWAMLIDAYIADHRLVPALSETFPTARAADQLDVDGVRAALTANGPLDVLTPLLPLEDRPDPVALRDIAIRAITALIFPSVPPAPPQTGRRQVRNTGLNWQIVRATLQEPAWSQTTAKAAEARTRLWSAAVAQLFLHRGNIRSAAGLFRVSDVKEGARQDPRSVRRLLLEARAGEFAAWSALVDRMVPNLIHAPEPLITPGQGSEASAQRKGVRRTPSSAVAALKEAYRNTTPALSRELLLAFAEAVLTHPDALTAPEAPDGTVPICFGDQSPLGGNTPIVPGMILIPDSKGQTTALVADKAWFDKVFSPDLPRTKTATVNEDSAQNGQGEADSADTTPDTMTVTDSGPTDPRTRLAELRQQLPARIDLTAGSYEHAIQSANALLAEFRTAHQLREELEEQPLSADKRIEWMEKLTKARDTAATSANTLGEVEKLILNL